MSFRRCIAYLPFFVSPFFVCFAVQGDETVVEPYLLSGKLEDGRIALEKLLSNDPSNDQYQFELGVLRFLQGVENLGQALFEFAPHRTLATIGPLLRLPVPKNPRAKAVELQDIRDAINRFNQDLTIAEKVLSKVESDNVRLPLKVFQLRLDFDNDGKSTENDNIQPVLMQYLGGGVRRANNVDLTDVVIVFDRSDVDWLRGYCCLLRSMCEVVLAYDQSLFWETVGHRLFERGVVSSEFLREEARRNKTDFNIDIMDLIAGIHNARFKLIEPERLKLAHQHLLDTIRFSRDMWKRINLETDDDREWIPSPNQKNAIARTRVSRMMVASWGDFLDESEKLLKGEKLIPFWRGTDHKRGVNLHRVFHRGGDIDVVLWVHGLGVVPYLDRGECTSEETWREFQRVFRGNFFAFAIWFN